MRGIKIAGRIFSALLTGVLAVILACNLYTIAARQFGGVAQPTVFGWSWAVVISGSMEPEIHVNDMVVAKKAESYSVGEVITFETDGTVVTHRIQEITPEGYITKGDANNARDQAVVRPDQVVGALRYVIPEAGLAIEYMRTPLGMMCIVFLGLALLAISSLLEDRNVRAKQGGNSNGE